MKLTAIILVGASCIFTADAGCPFAHKGFHVNGAAPSFVQQDVFHGPYSHCDEFGNCNIVHKNQQNLQANDANSGPSAKSSGNEVCIDELPPHSAYKTCAEAARAWGGCNEMKALGACNRTCATCSPVFVSQYGKRSGTPFDIDQDDELAQGGGFYLPKIPRKKCKPYNLKRVVSSTRDLFNAGLGDIPASLRMGFHDAGDFDKWTLTGGADGRFANSPEAWYGQSRSTNKGLLCVNQLEGKFAGKKGFEAFSAGDAVQICAMVAVEVAGGPRFEEFNFVPGRVQASGVTNDGMLPNPNGNHATLRDYYYRMGLNDLDIVALSGAHTLGGGAGSSGSGYTMPFTANSKVFDNSYFVQLVEYENPSSGENCDYFSMSPSQRGATGGCHVGPKKNLLQLPTDRALMLDPTFKEHVELFARDEKAFFQQFARSMKKLSELGKDTSVQWCDFE